MAVYKDDKIESYKVGSIIKGQVTGIEKYGIFVNIDPWYDGLIHISEVSRTFVKNIHDYVKIGETIYCQILEIDEDNYIYVKLTGACSNCLMQDDTINDGLLTMFQDEIPEIEGIINIPL